MTRAFCIPGVVFLLAATVLSAIAAVSLPYLSVIDIARVHIKSGDVGSGSGGAIPIDQIRFGVWGVCYYNAGNGDKTCTPAENAYKVGVSTTGGNGGVIIGRSWTRGLAVHPVAAGVTFLALLASLSTHITVQLIASLLAFLASLLTLIAFAIDIALYAYVKHKMNDLPNVKTTTNTAPAFWLTFAAFLLTAFAGCTVCFGRRRERMYNATTSPSTYPANTTTATSGGRFGWLSRFRRNKY